MVAGITSLAIIVVAVFILAIITEEFFVISLSKLATVLKMPSDVAGASLMAMGSSAPELFIALIAVFIGGAHSDVGIGTIVGSAVFNILVITGASALIAGNMPMKKGAIERDIIFYLGSVGLLLYVFWDGQITLLEAGILMAVYVGYLGLLYYWSSSSASGFEQGEESDGSMFVKEGVSDKNLIVTIGTAIKRAFGLVARDPEKHYIWSLLVSIAAIAVLSYALVESAVVLSNVLGLPPLIVSLTILAAGTSAPDLIASIDVAQDGQGTMAVANAVGSNIFDVLVGLGVPWLIILVVLGDTVTVGTNGLIESVFLLSLTVIILYILIYTGRELTRREGGILLGVYVLYVSYVIVSNSVFASGVSG